MSALVNPTPLDRLMASIRALLRAEDPNRSYRGTWEYIVQASDGKTCDMTPSDTTISLPQLTKVPMRAGLPGTIGTPVKGSLAYVTFANGDPTKPVIVAYDNTLPASITLASGVLPVARMTDSVVAGIFAGTITQGSPLVKSG